MKYAEVNNGFVVGFHERTDSRVPEFSPPRIAVKVTPPFPTIGDEYDGTFFFPPTRPNPNLLPPPETNREILEETRKLVEQILTKLTPGPP